MHCFQEFAKRDMDATMTTVVVQVDLIGMGEQCAGWWPRGRGVI
jgi:hypothetical protein